MSCPGFVFFVVFENGTQPLKSNKQQRTFSDICSAFVICEYVSWRCNLVGDKGLWPVMYMYWYMKHIKMKQISQLVPGLCLLWKTHSIEHTKWLKCLGLPATADDINQINIPNLLSAGIRLYWNLLRCIHQINKQHPALTKMEKNRKLPFS